nr:hypothetical protein B0A51_02486 [Rachicladosporium sp. CCFEE 5018]
MAAQDTPLAESDDWRKRFNTLLNRAKIGNEPAEKAIDTVQAGTLGHDPPAEADAWKAGWWTFPNGGSITKGSAKLRRLTAPIAHCAPLAEGREKLAAMKAAETALERADDEEGQEAEHERIYLFFQKRYGGDSSSLHAW